MDENCLVTVMGPLESKMSAPIRPFMLNNNCTLKKPRTRQQLIVKQFDLDNASRRFREPKKLCAICMENGLFLALKSSMVDEDLAVHKVEAFGRDF
jgi:hypothetical protein